MLRKFSIATVLLAIVGTAFAETKFDKLLKDMGVKQPTSISKEVLKNVIWVRIVNSSFSNRKENNKKCFGTITKYTWLKPYRNSDDLYFNKIRPSLLNYKDIFPSNSINGISAAQHESGGLLHGSLLAQYDKEGYVFVFALNTLEKQVNLCICEIKQ